MVSVERVKQFTKIPSEAEWEIKDRLPPPNWPAQGNVDLKDLQVIVSVNSPEFYLLSDQVISESVICKLMNCWFKKKKTHIENELLMSTAGEVSVEHSVGSERNNFEHPWRREDRSGWSNGKWEVDYDTSVLQACGALGREDYRRRHRHLPARAS